MTELQIDPAAATAGTRSGENAPPSGRRDWQRISLFLGGIMFAVGNMLHPLEHKDAAYESATWEAAHLTIFFSLPLLVLGLPYLQRRLAARHRFAARHASPWRRRWPGSSASPPAPSSRRSSRR